MDEKVLYLKEKTLQNMKKTLVKKTSVPKRKNFKKTKTFYLKSFEFVQRQILAL